MAIVDAGFIDIVDHISVAPGVPLTCRANDAAGCSWWFEVAGGRTGTRPGLQRTELVWRAIGKGAVVAAADPSSRYVVLGWGLPSQASGGKALQMVSGPGQPVAAVVDLSTGADGVERLRVLANSPVAVG